MDSNDEPWWEKLLASWFPTFVKWLSGTYATLYLAFIPTDVLGSWARAKIAAGGILSKILSRAHGLVGARWFFWLTITCLVLWLLDLSMRVLRWFLVERRRKIKMTEKDERIAELEREITSLKADVEAANERIEDKKSELVALQQGIGEMFHKYLTHLSESLGCGETERISLYVIQDGSTKVELMRRYPDGGGHGNIRRTTQKTSEGVIGRAMTKRFFYIAKFPDPETNFSAYAKKQRKLFCYTENDVRGFSMKARTYFSFRVSQKDSHAGFVVIESSQKEFSDEAHLKSELLKHNDFLYYVISAFRNQAPTYEQAMKENF